MKTGKQQKIFSSIFVYLFCPKGHEQQNFLIQASGDPYPKYIVGCRGEVQLGGHRSSNGLYLVDPTKVKTCKSFIYAEGSLKV